MNKKQVTVISEKNTVPRIDYAEQHLNFIAAAGEKFLFLAIDDNKERANKPVEFYGTLQQHQDELIRLNLEGYGIFFTVNVTKGKKRTEENISAYRGVWIENDSGLLSNSPIKPDLVIETSPGKYHEYFLCEGLDYFQRIALQEKMVVDHNSDPNAADASRVLRLAGFYHQKKDKSKGLSGEPHLVWIIEENIRQKMDPLSLLMAFDCPADFQKLIQSCPKAAARYSRFVFQLKSVGRCFGQGDNLVSISSEHIAVAQRILNFMSIGNDENHLPLSSALLSKIYTALIALKAGILSEDIRDEAITSLELIESEYQAMCPQQTLYCDIGDDASNDLQYMQPEYELDRVKEALVCIEPDDRGTWINVGLALKSHLGPSGEGYKIWDVWSQRSYKYNADEMPTKWKGLTPNSISIATVFHLAKEHLRLRVRTAHESGELNEKNRQQWLDDTVHTLDLEKNSMLISYIQECIHSELCILPFGLTSAAKLTSQPYQPNWLIKGYLEQGTLTHIFGKPASGKSFVALSMGFCISNGIPWFGAETEKGGVVYIAGEGRSGLRKRLKALEVHYSQTESNFFVSDLPGRLIDEDNVSDIVESIKAVCPDVKLLIVDTLHRNMGAGDENSAEDFAKILSNLSRIMAINDTSVLLVHHSGHSDSGRGRGTSSITAAMDMEYSIKKVGMVVTMTCCKSKDNEEPAPLAFDMKEVDTGWMDDDLFPVFSVVLEKSSYSSSKTDKKLNSKVQQCLDILEQTIETFGQEPTDEVMKAMIENGYYMENSLPQVVHIDEWKKQLYPVLDIRSDSKNPDEAKRKSFDRSREKLREMGLVDMLHDYWWIMN